VEGIGMEKKKKCYIVTVDFQPSYVWFVVFASCKIKAINKFEKEVEIPKGIDYQIKKVKPIYGN
jgi:hypothetical protein